MLVSGEKGSARPGEAGLRGASARPKRFSSQRRLHLLPRDLGQDAHPLPARLQPQNWLSGAWHCDGTRASAVTARSRRARGCACLAPAGHRAGSHQPEDRQVPGPAPSMARSPVARLGEEPESGRRGGALWQNIVRGSRAPGCPSSGKQSHWATEPLARVRRPAPRPAPTSQEGGVTGGGSAVPAAFALPGPSPAGAPAAGPARLTQRRLSDHRDSPTPPRVTAGLTGAHVWHSRPSPTTSRAQVHGADPVAGATCSLGARTVGPAGRGTGEGQKQEAGDTWTASLRGVLV